MSCIQFPGGWHMTYANTRLNASINIGGASRTANISIQTGWRTLGTGASPLRASGWHHMGITFDGRYLKMYLNGSQYATVADAGSDDNTIHHDSGSPGTDEANQPTCMDTNDADLAIGGDPSGCLLYTSPSPRDS